MFGYIRPYKSELLVREYEIYKAIYCTVCKRLGNKFGLISRFVLSYDATFIALLFLSLKKECCGFVDKRCVVNPLKSCKFCSNAVEEIDFAAAICMILAYYKLRDDIKDDGILGKIKSSLMYPFFVIPYKNAINEYKEVNSIIEQYIKNQDIVEEKIKPSIDESAEPTAIMFKRLFELIYNTTNQKDDLANFGYFLGKWVYFVDAIDDMDKDSKNNNFNPFTLNNINKENITQSNIKYYYNEVLNQSISRALESYNKLKIYNFKNIIDNIINMGLPQMQKQILFKEGDNVI